MPIDCIPKLLAMTAIEQAWADGVGIWSNAVGPEVLGRFREPKVRRACTLLTANGVKPGLREFCDELTMVVALGL